MFTRRDYAALAALTLVAGAALAWLGHAGTWWPPATNALAAVVYHPVVDAGPDQQVIYPAVIELHGTVSGGAPLDWWTADGNGPMENSLVRVTGTTVSSIGPMRDLKRRIYGYTTDLVRVGRIVYGADTALRQIHVLDPATGLATPVQASWLGSYSDIQALAYDQDNDRLHAIDRARRVLLFVDRSTGLVTPVGDGRLSAFEDVRSLAWRAADGQLYAVDNATAQLIRVDPTTSMPVPVVILKPEAAGGQIEIEEMAFHGGDLYVVRLVGDDGSRAQLARLSMSDGRLRNVGPVIDGVSAHCLLIEAVPEAVTWTMLSGPGDVTFSDPLSATPTATFPEAGEYVLRFEAAASLGAVADTMTVTLIGVSALQGPVGGR